MALDIASINMPSCSLLNPEKDKSNESSTKSWSSASSDCTNIFKFGEISLFLDLHRIIYHNSISPRLAHQKIRKNNFLNLGKYIKII